MALGILFIVFIVLAVTAVFIQILLYRRGNETTNVIFIINMLLGVLLAYLAFSALPTNFTGQRTVAIVWGVLAVAGMALKLATNKFIMLSKILLTVAIVGSLVQLFA